MNDSYSVGADIDAWCTKCKLESAHTIVAIVDSLPKKVKCNTCKAQHVFRTKPIQRKSSTRKSKTKETTYEEYIARLGGSESVNSRKYDTKGNFEKDEIIDHLNFGVGIVLSVIQDNKIKILFKDGPRLLTQNQ